MTTNTTPPTKWGEPIEVNGVCPDWLRKTDVVDCKTSDGWTSSHWTKPYRTPPKEWFWKYGCGRPYITHIRLPADHPYYLATSRGFKYWPGGDEAPDDVGGHVLFGDGTTYSANNMFHWRRTGDCSDIIGYKPKVVEAATPAATPATDEPCACCELRLENERMKAALQKIAEYNNAGHFAREMAAIADAALKAD